MQPASEEAYALLHQGSLALANVQCNGMRIDLPYLDGAIKAVTEKIKGMEAEMQKDEVFRTWENEYGSKMKIASEEQFAHVLFDIMKYPCTEYTPTGRAKITKSVLEDIDLPFAKLWVRVEQLKKARGTYLEGIKWEVNEDGMLHPFFNLNTVLTYRSSSSQINFQNIPARDEEIGKMIRQCFIPRDGYCLVEVDFKRVEVCVAACYNKDPKLIEFVCDEKKCMHRDSAAKLYCLTTPEVSKQARQIAKGSFVFPQFYGDYYASCAKFLWKYIDRFNLATTGGKPLKQVLAEHGINTLGDCNPEQRPKPGTFEYQVKLVEDWFWNDMFKVYTQWKRDWYKKYQKRGWIEMLTGFVCRGRYSRNDVINYPIQGSAFHCMLWSLIKLNNWLVKNKFKTVIIGQIHDSIVMDVYLPEIDDVLNKANKIITTELPAAWKWINVPIGAETAVSPEGKSWYEKKEFVCTDYAWSIKND